MSLDIQFFKNDVDFRKLREDIDTLYETLRSTQDKIDQLEDDYEDATLSTFNITHNPDKYKAYNPPNGWGNYEGFVSFCNSVLQKCREYPDAVIEAAR